MMQDDTKKGQAQTGDDTIVHFDLSGDNDPVTEPEAPSLTVNLNEEENGDEESPLAFSEKNMRSDDTFVPATEPNPMMMGGATPFSLMGDTTDIETILDTLDNAVEELKTKRIETKRQHEDNIRAKEEEIEREKEKMELDDRNYEERITAVTQRLEGIRGKLPAGKNNVLPFKAKDKKEDRGEMRKAA